MSSNRLKTDKSFTRKDQQCIPDIYDNVNQIYDVLRKLNFKNSNVIVAIDTSNTSLKYKREYMNVLNIIANTLKEFDDDGLIPTLLFNNEQVLNMKQFVTGDENSKNCHGLDDVMRIYGRLDDETIYEKEYGMTGVFKKVKEILNENTKGEYYLLITLTSGHDIKAVRYQIDGYQVKEKMTKEDKEKLKQLKRRKHAMKQHDKKLEQEIKSMCKYPVSMINIGVGNSLVDSGDYFDAFNTMDDMVKGRKFDNYQFVNYSSIFKVADETTDVKSTNDDVLVVKQLQDKFVLEMLREVPIQYSYMLENKMLK
jgi:hypothetical protein